MMRGAAYMAAAGVLFIIAIVFASIAVYELLERSQGSVGAALIVTAILGLAGFLVMRMRGSSHTQSSNPLSFVTGLTDSRNLQEVEHQARRVISKVGPVKLSALAFVAGLIIARRI